MVGHTGRQDGGSAILVLAPATDTAIAIMTNAKGWNGYLGFALAIRETLNEMLASGTD